MAVIAYEAQSVIHYPCNGEYKRQRHTAETKTNICIRFTFLSLSVLVCMFMEPGGAEAQHKNDFLPASAVFVGCYMEISPTHLSICLYLP